MEGLKLFLCHASGDKGEARALYDSLRKDGFSPWLDEYDILPGRAWEDEIRASISASHCILVLLSEQAVNKEGFVQKEIRYALDKADEKPEGVTYIIPIRLHECTVPSRLQKWQWVDLFGGNGYLRLFKALRVRAEQLGLASQDSPFATPTRSGRISKQEVEPEAARPSAAASAGDSAAAYVPTPQRLALLGQKGLIGSASFAPDGSLLASGTHGSIFLWHTRTGRHIGTLAETSPHAYNVSFSPAGRILAAGNADGLVYLWDVRTFALLRKLSGHEKQVLAVAFSKTGRLLATCGADSELRVWKMPSGTVERIIRGHRSQVHSVCFAPDGKLLASGGSDGTVRLWYWSQEKQVAKLSGHEDMVSCVKFSPDGETIASASWDKTIRLWSLRERRESGILEGHGAEVNALEFFPDGKTLISGSYDKSIRLWDVAHRLYLFTLEGHRGLVYDISLSSDGRYLASGSADKSVRLWTFQRTGTASSVYAS